LSRDGRFARRGFIGFAGGGTGGGGAISQEGQAAGTYRITGNTIELSYGGGRSERHTFFVYPGEENVLVIDGVTFLRRGQ
jgi:hypothetical protein